jgi:hypothetical protein
MKALFLWRLNKAKEAEVTLGVCSQRRMNIFNHWFSYIHEVLPKLKQAKAHYLRFRFIVFRKYVKSKSSIRIHRRKISAVTANNITHNHIN